MNGNEWHVNFRETASYKATVSIPHSIIVDKSYKERLRYADEAFPLGVRTVIYSYLIEHTINCHWHYDFEYGLVLDGSVNCRINDTHIRLKKGDIYFVNSNILHMSMQIKPDEDAVMYALTFPSSLLSDNINSNVYSKYIAPLLSKSVDGFYISGDDPAIGEMRDLLTEIYENDPNAFGYELDCHALVDKLWIATLTFIENNKNALLYSSGNIRHSVRIKEILSYIHAHYSEKITANDIAAYVNISRSECFRCFKYYMNKTIMEYMNEYRLQQAARLLRETERRIIDIGETCGFENASYFNKNFKTAYSMTPLQYRKAKILTKNTRLHTNGYDYEYYKSSGNGVMIIAANANNGAFFCDWHNVWDIMFRSGKQFSGFDKTYRELGHISLKFDATYTSDGTSYLCVYGWTVDPLIEWYIVECRTDLDPSTFTNFIGTHELDGDTYGLYSTTRVNQPSIFGIRDFGQYWSVRASNRFSGTVDVSEHMRAFESAGLPLGKIAEVALCIEGYQSNGKANVNTNELTIDGGTD